MSILRLENELEKCQIERDKLKNELNYARKELNTHREIKQTNKFQKEIRLLKSENQFLREKVKQLSNTAKEAGNFLMGSPLRHERRKILKEKVISSKMHAFQHNAGPSPPFRTSRKNQVRSGYSQRRNHSNSYNHSMSAQNIHQQQQQQSDPMNGIKDDELLNTTTQKIEETELTNISQHALEFKNNKTKSLVNH